MFDIKKLIRIKTNISDFIIVVYFTEKYESKYHLIIYLLKKLSSAKRNSDIQNIKLLAIVASLEIYRVYIKRTPENNIYIGQKNPLYFITTN